MQQGVKNFCKRNEKRSLTHKSYSLSKFKNFHKVLRRIGMSVISWGDYHRVRNAMFNAAARRC